MGQLLGGVMAETYTQAQRAARAVRVEYEELPHVNTIQVCTTAAKPFFLLGIVTPLQLFCKELTFL